MAFVKPLEWWSGWADFFGVIAMILGGILVLVTLLGWTFSWKAGKLKKEAVARYQVEVKQSIAEANKATSLANQQAAAANLELARLQGKMVPRRLNKAQ